MDGGQRVRVVGTDFMETYTGGQYSLSNIQPEDIVIEDIAHSLSYLCRYNGHCSRFYSVAIHCCVLADFAVYRGYSDREVLTTLMHDAAESYMGDMIRPLKILLPEFIAIESAIEKVIAEKYNLIFPMPDWLKDMDSRVLLDERAAVMLNGKCNTWDVEKLEPLYVSIPDWSPAKAEEEFLHRFCELWELTT